MNSAADLFKPASLFLRKLVWALLSMAVLLAVLPALISSPLWLKWGIAAVLLCAVAAASGMLLAHTSRLHTQVVERWDEQAHDLEQWKRQAGRLEEACRQSEADHQSAAARREERLSEQQRELSQAHEALSRTERVAEELRQQAHTLQSDLHRAQSDLSGCLSRRQALESQNHELDLRVRDLGEAHAAAAAQQREARAEAVRLTDELATARAESETFRSHSLRLRQELEAVKLSLSNEELRRSGLTTQFAELQSRAENAEQSARRLERDRPGQEELAARQRQIEELRADERAARREREALAERCSLLESEREGLRSEVDRLVESRQQADRLLEEVQQQLQHSRSEKREDAAAHFTWKLNYFRPNEVVFNYVNLGLPMEVIGAWSDPQLTSEVSGDARVARGGEGRIRFFSEQPLPREFVARFRFTVYPQEFRVRVRPFDENKIEHL